MAPFLAFIVGILTVIGVEIGAAFHAVTSAQTAVQGARTDFQSTLQSVGERLRSVFGE